MLSFICINIIIRSIRDEIRIIPEDLAMPLIPIDAIYKAIIKMTIDKAIDVKLLG